jgi:hypothetical protein
VDEPMPPLPPETRVAIGALALLSMQEAHEVALFCIGSSALGRSTLGAGAAILLVLVLGILIGLCARIEGAWWLGVLVLGGIGGVFLTASWPLIQGFLPGEKPAMVVVAAAHDYEWLRPAMSRFQAGWLIAKVALLLMVPVMLLMGALRERLRHR